MPEIFGLPERARSGLVAQASIRLVEEALRAREVARPFLVGGAGRIFDPKRADLGTIAHA